MLFNSDLIEVISEAYIGYTIPTALTNTDIYCYFSNHRSVDYNIDALDIGDFVDTAMNDTVFMKYVCLSKETARWFKAMIESQLNPAWEEDPGLDLNALLRAALVLDDRDSIKTYITRTNGLYDSDILYAFATIDQMKWLISIDRPRLHMSSVKSKIGRLCIMKLVYESQPDMFTNYRCTLNQMQYTNRYDHRPLETLEWLIDTLNLSFTEHELYTAARIYNNPRWGDDSTFQWLMINHTEIVINVCLAANHENVIMACLFQNFNKRTVELYFEKIDRRPLVASIGETKMATIRYLHSLMASE